MSCCTFWPAHANRARKAHTDGISELGARTAGRDFGRQQGMTPVPHRECWPHLYMQQQQSAASIVPQLCSGSNLLPFALPQSGSLHDVVQTLACTTCCAFAFVVIFSGSELTPTGTAPTAAIMSSRRAMRFIPDVILTLTLSKLSANHNCIIGIGATETFCWPPVGAVGRDRCTCSIYL